MKNKKKIEELIQVIENVISNNKFLVSGFTEDNLSDKDRKIVKLSLLLIKEVKLRLVEVHNHETDPEERRMEEELITLFETLNVTIKRNLKNYLDESHRHEKEYLDMKKTQEIKLQEEIKDALSVLEDVETTNSISKDISTLNFKTNNVKKIEEKEIEIDEIIDQVKKEEAEKNDNKTKILIQEMIKNEESINKKMSKEEFDEVFNIDEYENLEINVTKEKLKAWEEEKPAIEEIINTLELKS